MAHFSSGPCTIVVKSDGKTRAVRIFANGKEIKQFNDVLRKAEQGVELLHIELTY